MREKPTPIIASPAELKQGDPILAVITSAPAKGDIYLHCENHGEDDFCIIRGPNRGPDKYKEGNSILLIVIATKETPGGWIIECEKFN